MNEEIKFEKSLALLLWLGLFVTIGLTILLLTLTGKTAHAQEGIAELGLMDQKLEFLKEDIIDSREVPIYEMNEKTKIPVKTLLKEVQYYYAGDYTDKDIVAEGDYSYTERVNPNKYRIYTAPFILGDSGYRTLETATTSVMHWYEQMEMEAKDPISKLWDPLFIETHAQENIFSGNDDGNINNSGSNWSTVISAGSGSEILVSGAQGNLNSIYNSGGTYYLQRDFLFFDLSTIEGTIESGTINWKQAGKNNGINDGYDYFTFFEATNAGALENGDFDSFTSTQLTDPIDITDTTDGSYMVFDLNQDGIDYVNEKGTSKFCAREGHDINGIAPSGSNTWNVSGGYPYMSEQTGTDSDPFLEITIGAETSTTTPTASTTPGWLMPIAQGLQFVLGLFAIFTLFVIFLYIVWPI